MAIQNTETRNHETKRPDFLVSGEEWRYINHYYINIIRGLSSVWSFYRFIGFWFLAVRGSRWDKKNRMAAVWRLSHADLRLTVPELSMTNFFVNAYELAARPIAGSQLSPRVALQFAVDLTILARKHNDGTNGV